MVTAIDKKLSYIRRKKLKVLCENRDDLSIVFVFCIV